MAQVSYSFCMAMLHSFWQAALLLLLFIVADKILFRNNPPLAKRNLLYASLASQLVLFFLTFAIYYSEAESMSSLAGIGQSMTAFFGNENILMLAPWIFNLYLFVITYKLIKAVYTWYSFKQQYKNGLQKPSVDLKLFTELKAYQFGISRKVKLWLSTSIHTPVTFGFFKPVILLPVALINNISIEQTETLVLHELTHIRTNDYLLNWFLLLTESIFFFNPFVGHLCKKIRLEREKNCDMRVMNFNYSPALYAETLLKAERIKQLVPNFHLAAVNRKKQLLSRIQYFTNDKNFKQPMRFNIIAPLVGLFLLLFFSTAVLFHSNNNVPTVTESAVLPYLPFSSDIVPVTDPENNILPVEKTGNAVANNVETEHAVIRNEAIQMTPADIRQKPAPVISQPVENFAVLPVAVKENDASRQVIIKEEGSGGASVKIYYLSFENGQWILKPQIMVTAKEVILDSIRQRSDSSIDGIKRILPQQ